MAQLLGELPIATSTDGVVVGLAAFDDAGVIQSPRGDYLVQTLDFFTPIVDDPYVFGAAAAANSLSDVYAMGGVPLSALTIACLPIQELPASMVREMMKGAMDKLKEAHCELLGGHTIQDKELKFGFSVTGIVEPTALMTKAKAKAGDQLVLTKRIGTGVLATAAKRGVLSKEGEDALHESLMKLNATAAKIATDFHIQCATDVTGFGLLGHALDLAKQSQLGLSIFSDKVPLLPTAYELALDKKNQAGGLNRNRLFIEAKLSIEFDDEALLTLLFDPQTSGGLLFAVRTAVVFDFVQELTNRGETANIIGEFVEGDLQMTLQKSAS